MTTSNSLTVRGGQRKAELVAIGGGMVESRAPPELFVQSIAMKVLGCVAEHRFSQAINVALGELGIPRSTRSYHMRNLATKGLITVKQGWHEEFVHVRVYEYELTPMARILLDATRRAEAEIQMLEKPLVFG